MARKKKVTEQVTLDNKPISPIIAEEEKEIIPKGFVKIPPKKIEKAKTINVKNGRVYKDLGNGYGKFSDNGETFKI